MSSHDVVPRHLLRPGQEGYRTPTIEDNDRPSVPSLWTPQPPLAREHGDEEAIPSRSLSRHFDEALSAGKLEGAGGRELRLRLIERIRHFTWVWFTMTMATGGIANVLHSVPFRFRGLYAIGCAFFLLNVLLFLFNVSMISLRFYLFPGTFRSSVLHPTESLFIPASVVSFGTILMNISQYGVGQVGPWLNTAVVVLFWLDCALAVIFSCGIYLILWSTQTFTVSQMTPVWIFPAYPLLIIGPHAAVLSSTISRSRALDVIIGGVVLQGIGFMVSLMIYSAFIYRLMTQKLPKEALRPGMFVSVGPAGFTVAAIVGMAANVDRALPDDFMGDGKQTAFILRVMGNWIGIWLWGLVLWFFLISVFAHCSCVGHGRMQFAMTWYSFVFPNTAMATSTFAVGEAFRSHGIQVVGAVMAVALVVLWLFVFGMMIRAVSRRQILWPQRGEDRDEGGFLSKPAFQPRSRPGRGFRRAKTATA